MANGNFQHEEQRDRDASSWRIGVRSERIERRAAQTAGDDHAAALRRLSKRFAPCPLGTRSDSPPQRRCSICFAISLRWSGFVVPLLIFVLEVEANYGPFWLHMTGDEDVQKFIQAEMELT